MSLPDYLEREGQLETGGGNCTEKAKYVGGSPMYDDKLKMYDCTAFNTNITSFFNAGGNAMAGLSWTANEVSADEYKVGMCDCESVTNEEYRSAWTCTQADVSTT